MNLDPYSLPQDKMEEDEEAEIMTEQSEMNEQDLDDSRMLDVRMASDKLLRIVRDYIISRNCSIKEAFGIDSIS